MPPFPPTAVAETSAELLPVAIPVLVATALPLAPSAILLVTNCALPPVPPVALLEADTLPPVDDAVAAHGRAASPVTAGSEPIGPPVPPPTAILVALTLTDAG